MDGRTESIVRRGHLTCHCLLVEADSSLVLIDTGMGLLDVANPQSRLSAFFLTLVKPEFREDMTAVRQIRRMGFDPRDVRHIVMTHLDFDHAGGLDDFPGAAVHMLASERDAAVAQKSWLDRQRFRPQQWSTRPDWRVHEPGEGEPWFGFNCVRAIEGLPREIIMVPLVGHTFGHSGIAVDCGDRWLLQAGDAYFFHAEMDINEPYCTPGLRFYQWMLEKDRRARLMNQDRLRQLRREHGTEVEIFCGHDLVEFERLSGRSAEAPAEMIQRPISRWAPPAEQRDESRA